MLTAIYACKSREHTGGLEHQRVEMKLHGPRFLQRQFRLRWARER